MREKIYLHLLILCGILGHGISAILSEEDNRESSNFLERKRRVINNLPGNVGSARIDQANYLVNIRENNRAKCAGAILSHYNVITAALCFSLHITSYQVLSGATYDRRSIFHSITSKEEYYGNPPHQINDGIALITIDPPFAFNKNTGFIHLHGRSLSAGTHVFARGWGCGYLLEHPPAGTRRKLQSIILPIMDHAECQHIYRENFNFIGINNGFAVTEKHICTNDPHQFCAQGDAGIPLVFNNTLIGIHVWKGEFFDHSNPDIYVDVNRPEYSAWIMHHTLLM